MSVPRDVQSTMGNSVWRTQRKGCHFSGSWLGSWCERSNQSGPATPRPPARLLVDHSVTRALQGRWLITCGMWFHEIPSPLLCQRDAYRGGWLTRGVFDKSPSAPCTDCHYINSRDRLVVLARRLGGPRVIPLLRPPVGAQPDVAAVLRRPRAEARVRQQGGLLRHGGVAGGRGYPRKVVRGSADRGDYSAERHWEAWSRRASRCVGGERETETEKERDNLSLSHTHTHTHT